MHGGHNTTTSNSTETWVSGDWYIDANSAVEATITYYTGRAPHVRITIRKDWVQSESGFIHTVLPTLADLDPPLASARSSPTPVT